MMGKSRLPPGFRFSPTDIELVKYYLERKVMGKRLHGEFIAELDIYKYSPWDLPDKSCWQSGDLKWYFFCPTAKKYSTGCRKSRITECGHWKATGKDRSVLYNGDVVGWIKTLVFHTGRAPKGDRTDWVMHEYRLETKNLADLDVLQDPYVLCMIFQKDGPGPKNGAQYGVPFKEEEWSDDEAEISLEAVPRENMPGPELELPSNYRSSITTSTDSLSGVRLRPSSESCLSDVVAPFCKVLQPVSSNHVTMGKQHVPNDDIVSMFDCFVEESASFIEENDKNEVPGNATHSGNASASFHFKGDDIYGGLGDLGNMARVSEDGDGISNLHNSICASDQMMPGDNGQFLELGDLDEPLMGETPFRFEDHLNMYDKVNF